MADQSDQGDGALEIGGTTDGDGPVVVDVDDDTLQALNEAGVDLDDVVADVELPDDVDIEIAGQTNAGDGVTVPVKDELDYNLTSASRSVTGVFRTRDPQIQKLEENSVRYSERVGEWILARDDLVPGIKERQKALIMGEGGLQVDPSDPDNEADQRLAEHLRELYDGKASPRPGGNNTVRASKVVDTILAENQKNARAVLRAVDMKPMDLSDLQYVRDGITGDEIYWQQNVTVTTFDVVEEGDGRDVVIDHEDVEEQPLVVGEQVYDIALYDRPPLEAVANTVVNKKVMQRLKARKAEITSFGAVVIKVEAPFWLDEEDYMDEVTDEDGNEITKLERAMQSSIQKAGEWAEDYQSGTTGAVPMHWEVDQLQIPEGDEPLDDQIRGYNRDISRRLLIPLDLIELREGSELSRDTLFSAVITTIEGWRQELIRVFDQFAQAQADIHSVSGSVEHSFPQLGTEDEELLVQLLQYAGLAGMSQNEVRQMMNNVEGVELSIEDDRPDDGEEDDDLQQQVQDRQEDMQQFLDEQNQDTDEGRAGPPRSREEAMQRGWSPTADVETDADAATTSRSDVLRQMTAQQFEEGTKVRLGDGTRGVVTEVRTSTFTGPDGDEHEATEDSPVYIVGTVDGAVAVPADDLEIDDWSSGQDNPVGDLGDVAQGMHADLMAALPDGVDPVTDGTLEAAGVQDWDYPPSWRKSPKPSRLILLDAWSSMHGQFDCPSQDCCKGTMRRQGMTERASDQFCAAMKDRVLLWEGWRQGG